jgi:hemolysin activation/secretion protein
VFNRFEAERYLLLAGDIPGYDVRLSLRSAEAGRGEVIGEVAVLRSAAEIDLNIQNFGSRDLGRFGGLLRGQFYGLTGLGDRTSIAIFSTADFEEQQTVQVGHDFRVGGEGLTFSGAFTYAWAEPDIDDPNLRVTARTLIGHGRGELPVPAQPGRDRARRDRLRSHQPARAPERPADQPRSSAGRVPAPGRGRDRSAEPGRRARLFGGGAALAGQRLAPGAPGAGRVRRQRTLRPHFRPLHRRGQRPLSRLEGDPTSTVLRGEVFGEYRPVPAITFALGVRAQLSSDPLLSFEEFSAGNYTVGRGYDPGSLLGDNGVGAQLEARFGSILPTSADRPSVQPYVFLDAAKIDNEDRLVADDDNELFSAGAGLRGIYRGTTLDVAFAVPLKRAGLQLERPNPRLLISLTTRLFPWSF